MRVAIVLILVATLGAAVPAVYYDLWFVVDNVHVATSDASGSGYRTLWTSAAVLADSIATDGRYLYVIESRARVVRLDPSTSPVTAVTIYTGTDVSCLAMGRVTGDLTALFIATNRTLVSLTLGSTTAIPVVGADYTDGGACRYLTFTSPWLFWTTERGLLFKFNTRMTGAVTQAVSRSGASDQGIAVATGANLLLYVSNATSLQSQTLNVATETAMGSVGDATWMRNSANRSRAIITLNGAVVISSSSGIQLVFSPFQPGPNQYVSRTILSSVSGISGICTNGGALATASWLLLLLVPLVLS